MIPILYTPTVGMWLVLVFAFRVIPNGCVLFLGDACLNYSAIWRRAEGLYISIHDKGRIEEVLRNWPGGNNARIAVVTDGTIPFFFSLRDTRPQTPLKAPGFWGWVILVPMVCLLQSENCMQISPFVCAYVCGTDSTAEIYTSQALVSGRKRR
jgi:hypothetical protein